jgi:hypothetical protein
MKKLLKKLLLTAILLSGFAFAGDKDGVPVIPDDPTDEQMQLVRDGAANFCVQDDEDARAQCVADYYAQHNLDEEPSCD